jgi:hypothetical protein
MGKSQDDLTIEFDRSRKLIDKLIELQLFQPRRPDVVWTNSAHRPVPTKILSEDRAHPYRGDRKAPRALRMRTAGSLVPRS